MSFEHDKASGEGQPPPSVMSIAVQIAVSLVRCRLPSHKCNLDVFRRAALSCARRDRRRQRQRRPLLATTCCCLPSLTALQRVIIYPNYLDNRKTVAQGRRIPKELGEWLGHSCRRRPQLAGRVAYLHCSGPGNQLLRG